MFRIFGSSRCTDSFLLTDAGMARAENEDAVFANSAGTVFAVADGMGGAEGGELASAIIREELSAAAEETGDFMTRIERIDLAILQANDRIRAVAAEKGYANMGSTVAVVVLDADSKGPRLAMGHLGDSRVYRRRKHILERMTDDHRKSEYSHLLTRAVGVSDRVEVDWCWAGVEKGDVWLVCTDGVHGMIPDSTINAVLARGGSAEEICRHLSEAVRRAGAHDNYTMALFMV